MRGACEAVLGSGGGAEPDAGGRRGVEVLVYGWMEVSGVRLAAAGAAARRGGVRGYPVGGSGAGAAGPAGAGEPDQAGRGGVSKSSAYRLHRKMGGVYRPLE